MNADPTHAEELVVALERDESGYPPADEEVLVARPLEPGAFELEAPPAFAYGMSKGDQVRAVSFENRWWADVVIFAGGHSTVRVIGFKPSWSVERHDALFAAGRRTGCEISRGPVHALFVIDVPPSGNIVELTATLQDGASQGWWDYDQASISDDHMAQLTQGGWVKATD